MRSTFRFYVKVDLAEIIYAIAAVVAAFHA